MRSTLSALVLLVVGAASAVPAESPPETVAAVKLLVRVVRLLAPDYGSN